MSVNLTLALGSAGMIAAGVYLLLERSLSRALIGLVLAGNGVAMGFLVSAGPAGKAPIMVEGVDPGDITDPLPQAMVLTAIVIMLATTAFVLAMAYRSWQLNGHDDVQDDPEDALIRRLATHDSGPETHLAEEDALDDEHEDSDFDEGELECVPVDETVLPDGTRLRGPSPSSPSSPSTSQAPGAGGEPPDQPDAQPPAQPDAQPDEQQEEKR